MNTVPFKLLTKTRTITKSWAVPCDATLEHLEVTYPFEVSLEKVHYQNQVINPRVTCVTEKHENEIIELSEEEQAETEFFPQEDDSDHIIMAKTLLEKTVVISGSVEDAIKKLEELERWIEEKKATLRSQAFHTY
jgi:hypothetical protein